MIREILSSFVVTWACEAWPGQFECVIPLHCFGHRSREHLPAMRSQLWPNPIGAHLQIEAWKERQLTTVPKIWHVEPIVVFLA
jgi:hypothetical protein